MNDELTTYRYAGCEGHGEYEMWCEKHKYSCNAGCLDDEQALCYPMFVPDARLQAIADAWNADLNGLRRDLDWPELTDLLDALGGAK